MPYEGQLSKALEVVQTVANTGASTIQPKHTKTQISETVTQVIAPKKMVTAGIKINTLSVGIKSTLEPKKSENAIQENAMADMATPFTFDELMKCWNDYALILKRDKKDKMHAVLTGNKPVLTSDYGISIEISNTALAFDLEKEKVNLLAYLRFQLKNGKISFNYKISEAKKVSHVDSKSHFERFADENPSLHKFRKLFNLDIDY